MLKKQLTYERICGLFRQRLFCLTGTLSDALCVCSGVYCAQGLFLIFRLSSQSQCSQQFTISLLFCGKRIQLNFVRFNPTLVIDGGGSQHINQEQPSPIRLVFWVELGPKPRYVVGFSGLVPEGRRLVVIVSRTGFCCTL